MGDAQVLLCWHSARAGNDVLVNAIKSLKKRKVLITKVLLLTQSEHKIDLSGLQDDVQKVQVEPVALELEDPTDHRIIYNRMIEHVLPKLKALSALHINVSPGTPAMHAVWLILHAGGRFPAGTKLWSSQKSPETKRNSIKEVQFPITTYLSEIRALQKSDNSFAIYEIESKSADRRRAFDSVKRFSSLTGLPFLVIGERGIGKTRVIETVVKTIKQKDVTTLACGSLDSNVVDSVLFGHKKGAFTGADTERDGLLKTADKGVLFLDEIQDLPQSVQRKLVRVLQDSHRKYRPVGSDDEISVTFDLICASNRPLAELSETLDKDFFDRISMLTTTLPPLRNCREDLLTDWQNVWAELRVSDSLPSTAPITKEIQDFLYTSDLPGNLRDLQRLVCLIMAYWQDNDSSNCISTALQEFSHHYSTRENTVRMNGISPTMGLSRSQLLNQFKKQLALESKSKFGTWRKAAAAMSCDEKTLRQDAGLPD
ncbi:sigma 54-interacting transcriptional regulator [Candidatus Haliotispira prima]|uniref:Sigma 54-interacting transcriptional regulator n=1 Tax=Candidatus Haliotispira prima TaxID=3034016 RepID=A0ABY8MFN0_9SPIO|nr:sigma 54-interacting transcriptional regulator [Candidatus Haliotispira prima]